MTGKWLSAVDLADLAGTTDRATRLAVARITAGHTKTWRGAHLVVRQSHGIGGSSGTQYEIRLDSLPFDLQEAFNAFQPASKAQLNHGLKHHAERDWRYEILCPALTFKRHSRDRAEIIREIVGRRHVSPEGKVVRFSERTVQRMLERYEDGFVLATLSRGKRSDTGVRRVILSKSFDRNVPFDDAVKQELASRIRQYVRSLTKAGESPSSIITLGSNRLAAWVSIRFEA